MVDTFGNPGSCPLKDVVCLVIDEAHRAMGNYSYCVVVRKVQYFIHVHKIYSSSSIFLHISCSYICFTTLFMACSYALSLNDEYGKQFYLLPQPLRCSPQLGCKQIFIITLLFFIVD